MKMRDRTSVYFMGRYEEYDEGDPRLSERLRDWRTVALPALLGEVASKRTNVCAYCGSVLTGDSNTCAQCGAPPTYAHTFHFSPVLSAATRK